MVYVGAIAILILFAIMFSRRLMGLDGGQNNQQWWLSLPIALVLFLVLVGILNAVAWPVSGEEPSGDPVLQLGLAFLGIRPEAHAAMSLSEELTMRSGVYNPWTDRCSDGAA